MLRARRGRPGNLRQLGSVAALPGLVVRAHRGPRPRDRGAERGVAQRSALAALASHARRARPRRAVLAALARALIRRGAGHAKHAAWLACASLPERVGGALREDGLVVPAAE